MTETKHKKTGFTLLELLIVIAIIAILSVILIIVINPAETLKKSRDVQRLSDLNTLKTAIGLVLTSSSTPYLDGAGLNNTCVGGGGTITTYLSQTGYTSGFPTGFTAFGASAGNTSVNGSGWIPIGFSSLSGGSPLSNLPLDPVNTAGAGALADTHYIYRYACQETPLTFELNGVLESAAYATDEDRDAKDGGDNNALYETGTALTIMD